VKTTLSRRAAGVALAATAAAAIAAAPAGAMPACGDAGNPCPSGPKTAPGTVDVAAGYHLIVRRAPRPDARQVRRLKDGAHVVIVCQTNGAQMTGTFGTSTLWDKLARGGYVSDTYVATGSTGHAHGRPRDVVLRNDYPFPDASPRDADPWGFFHRECTSFVAYRLNRLKGFHFSNRMAGGHFGDAGNWDDNARALGYRVDDHPTVGSVMVRDSGTWGHVAIVAKVTRTQFMVEEYNHDVDHGYGTRWLSRSADSPDWDHFIHFRF
jgi:surface antigen